MNSLTELLKSSKVNVDDIYDFVIKNREKYIENVDKITGNEDIFKEVRMLIRNSVEEKVLMNNAIEGDHLGLVEYLIFHFPDHPIPNIAAYHESVKVLKWACDSGYEITDDTFIFALLNDKVESLKILYESGNHHSESVANTCASSGAVKCLRYMIDNNKPINFHEAQVYATGGGHMECLQLLRTKSTWNPNVPKVAMMYGKFDCFTYAHNNFCYLDKKDEDELNKWFEQVSDKLPPDILLNFNKCRKFLDGSI